MKFVGFPKDIKESDKNNDRIYYLKNGGNEEEMNMKVLFMKIDLNLIHGTQEGTKREN